MQALIVFAILGIVTFFVIHIRTLIKSLKTFFQWKKTDTYREFIDSHAEITLITIPLALAMTMNVLFIVSALLIPHLRDVIEYVFPFAIAGFIAIGILALKIYGVYFAKRIHKGGLDVDSNNSLSQMISVFAFAMIGVGLAGPTAMSHTTVTSIVAMFFSILFLVTAFVLLAIKLIIGFQAMFAKGINKAASPSLWIMIPILTLFGISFVRHKMALVHGFEITMKSIEFFVVIAAIFSMQLLFGYLGYVVMKKNKYFTDYVYGPEKDVGSFALICPGVALMVFGMFFVHKGLVSV